jgi:hypothetical protein
MKHQPHREWRLPQIRLDAFHHRSSPQSSTVRSKKNVLFPPHLFDIWTYMMQSQSLNSTPDAPANTQGSDNFAHQDQPTPNKKFHKTHTSVMTTRFKSLHLVVMHLAVE